MSDVLPAGQVLGNWPAYSLDLPPNALAPRAARALAVSALTQWNALVLAEDVELVVSELVTNSLGIAAEIGFTIAFAAETCEVEVAVWDDGAGTPTLTIPASDSVSGRGLQLVDAVAVAWGCSEGLVGIGKKIWARLAPKPTTAAAFSV